MHQLSINLPLNYSSLCRRLPSVRRGRCRCKFGTISPRLRTRRQSCAESRAVAAAFSTFAGAGFASAPMRTYEAALKSADAAYVASLTTATKSAVLVCLQGLVLFQIHNQKEARASVASPSPAISASPCELPNRPEQPSAPCVSPVTPGLDLWPGSDR